MSRASGDDRPGLPGFMDERLDFLGHPRTVFRRGQGPAVIVMSEIPGITPQVHRLATRVADAGYSVWLPQLFGRPMEALTPASVARSFAEICIRREFALFAANASSPVVDWLRALARHAHDVCGGPGVGAIGMCVTGNFALALMLDAPVIAPVLAQPSLPGGLTATQRAGLHVSPAELAAAHERIERQGARILGVRFDSDPLCRKERFDHLQREFGVAFERIEIAGRHANPRARTPPHSPLTTHLIDCEGEPTQAALTRLLGFLGEQLRR